MARLRLRPPQAALIACIAAKGLKLSAAGRAALNRQGEGSGGGALRPMGSDRQLEHAARPKIPPWR
jgi:hypothetical protein